MPSEQRLHLSTLLFDLARHVKKFAVPALLVLFGMSQSTGGPGGMFGRMPDRMGVVAVGAVRAGDALLHRSLPDIPAPLRRSTSW